METSNFLSLPQSANMPDISVTFLVSKPLTDISTSESQCMNISFMEVTSDVFR